MLPWPSADVGLVPRWSPAIARSLTPRPSLVAGHVFPRPLAFEGPVPLWSPAGAALAPSLSTSDVGWPPPCPLACPGRAPSPPVVLPHPAASRSACIRCSRSATCSRTLPPSCAGAPRNLGHAAAFGLARLGPVHQSSSSSSPLASCLVAPPSPLVVPWLTSWCWLAPAPRGSAPVCSIPSVPARPILSFLTAARLAWMPSCIMRIFLRATLAASSSFSFSLQCSVVCPCLPQC